MPRREVDITATQGVLQAFAGQNYRHWYALAEFVDNAVQSYIDHKDDLKKAHGDDYHLKVAITCEGDINDGFISVVDNAAGIAEAVYEEAFKTAKAKSNPRSLSQYGMGMKVAACWYSRLWSVKTSALGEPSKKIVEFNVRDITTHEHTKLKVDTHNADPNESYTEIRMDELNQIPRGGAIAKCKTHLADIYRVFIKNGELELRWNGELLEHKGPDILVAPEFNNKNQPKGPEKSWEMEIEKFDFGNGYTAHGRVAISPKSTPLAGLALFRAKRIIQGSGDEKYRPVEIYGQEQSYERQRLFGEIELEGVPKSFTTDSVKWTSEEQADFIKKLKDRIKPLIRQARNYRARYKAEDVANPGAEAARDAMQAVKDAGGDTIAEIRAIEIEESPPAHLQTVTLAGEQSEDIDFGSEKWRVIFETTGNPGSSDWMSFSKEGEIEVALEGSKTKIKRRVIRIRLNLMHSFMQRFDISNNKQKLYPISRIAMAAGLAEEICRDKGIERAGAFRRTINELLEKVFSTN